MQIGRSSALALAIALAPTIAHAAPLEGDRLPDIRAADLTGQVRSSAELAGRRALVVAITDTAAAEAAGNWYRAAEGQMPANATQMALVSIRLPFIVSTGFARAKARTRVPEKYWCGTLLDRGDMAKRLGLSTHDKVPYVFVVDENGRIEAAVHATVDAPDAQTVWQAMNEQPHE